MGLNNKEIKDLCDLIECGIFMFMKKYQENKSLTIKEFNSFLTDVTKLSKESDFPLIGYKVLRIKRNWALLEKCYEKDENLTPGEKSFVKLISNRFNNVNIEINNNFGNFSTELDEDKIINNNESINECVESFMEKINDEESQKTINASLDKLKELENYLELFEFCNIDSVSEELENCQTLWNVFSEQYDNLEKDPFVFEQIQIIKEMFETILIVVDESVFQSVVIDESELSKIESEIIKFDGDVSNNFFEKKTYKLQFSMSDGQNAYKLVEKMETFGGNIITYLSDHKYYNQNRKPIEAGKIHPVNLKFYSDVVMWDEEDKYSLSTKKTGKICVLDISPEIMNDFDCAFELDEEESIQIETGEYIKNIKYISLNRKFYDKDKDIIYVNQSCFDEITINNEVISVTYDCEKYNFKLTKKNSSFIKDRKEMDSSEYNKQKNEMEQNYHKIEAILSEYISQLDDQTDESVKIKGLLAKLETSRKRYMQ